MRFCALFWLAGLSAASGATIIRDGDIERALRELMRPIAVAAGQNPNAMRVLIIQDSALNAFVADGQTIFIHSGLILKLTTAAQLQAVLAHEIAHISNGHITRRLNNLRRAGLASTLGVAAAAVVAAGGNSKAAAGLAIGTSSSAQRVFFSHTRDEESAADQSAARFLARAGVSPGAMVEVLDLFRGQEALSPQRQDPYVRTHPLTADRRRAAQSYAAVFKPTGGDTKRADYWFARARGKLGAFLQKPSFTLRKIKASDQSDIAMMRRAVAYHRMPDTDKAVREISALVAKRPKDAYFIELKGEILLKARRFGPAVTAYRQAAALAPRDPQILAGLGRALSTLNTRAADREALDVLERARARDPYATRVLRDLGVVYARLGQNGMASLVTAERYALSGRLPDAALHATRAAGTLPHGSVGWRRAQDILAAAQNAQKRK